MSLNGIMERYMLERELRANSERQTKAIVKVFLNWLGVKDLPVDEFTGERISEFLLAKQREGRSSHYRRSLRNTLKALHRFGRGYNHCDPIRSVRLEPLEPEAWSPEEVAKLIEACDELRYRERNWWRLFLQVAYYTGLNAVDIHRLEKGNINERGIIPFNRSKTGKRVFVSVPADLAAELLAFAPEDGPIFQWSVSQEAFRLRFKRLIEIAGIRPGTFKRLRKTSGTLVEHAKPGYGHRHLGNEADIFAKHYEDRLVTQADPTMPPELPLPDASPARDSSIPERPLPAERVR